MKKSQRIIEKGLAINAGDKFFISCPTESESNYLLSDLKKQRNRFLKNEDYEVEELIIDKVPQEDEKYGVMLSKRNPDFTKASILKTNGDVENFDLRDEDDEILKRLASLDDQNF